MKRKLGVINIAASLISLHYGLGFLLGTSEMVFKNGISGILYALACALGLICLAFFVPFYWKNKYPIWTILGRKFGGGIKKTVMLLSWIWMIGIIASQVLGASYILKVLNIPVCLSIVLITIGITFIALLPIEKLAKVLTFLLLVSTITIILVIVKFSTFSDIAYIIQNLPKKIFDQGPLTSIGIIFPTMLVTILGMDFHQFIVQGKTIKKSIWGTLIAGFILILVSFLPVLVVSAATKNNIIPQNIDGKQVIPYMLMYFGTSFGNKTFGNILLLSLLMVAIGSGSALVKILIKTFSNFEFIPHVLKKKKNIIIINILSILFLALTGKTIISLIVDFYIIYIAGILIPFLIYISGLYKKIKVPNVAMYLSTLIGSISSLILLIVAKTNILPALINNNLEFSMIIIGIFFSLFTSFIIIITKTRVIIRQAH